MITQQAGLQIHIDDGPALHGRLAIESNEQVMWSNLPRPNPKWTYIDRQGHVHHYGPNDTLPTLTVRREHVDCDGSCDLSGCEGYGVSHYSCSTCGEQDIEPGLLTGPYAIVIPMGAPSWTCSVRGWPASGGNRVGEQVEVRLEWPNGRRASGTAMITSQCINSAPGWSILTTDLAGVTELIEMEPAA